MKLIISLLCFLVLFSGCDVKNRYNDMSTYSKKNKRLQAVIEVSSGSNRFFEYDYDSNVFKIRKINGEDELIRFLPCPVNVGFIPSTSRDISHSRKSPLDIIIITETLSTSSLIEIHLIGVMKMIENGKERNYILAEPYAKELKVLKVNDFADLTNNHPHTLEIIQNWFVNYKPELKSQFVSWGNEKEAQILVNNSILK